MRQIRNNLIIRLEKELSDSQIRELNENFKDLIETGEITKVLLWQMKPMNRNCL